MNTPDVRDLLRKEILEQQAIKQVADARIKDLEARYRLMEEALLLVWVIQSNEVPSNAFHGLDGEHIYWASTNKFDVEMVYRSSNIIQEYFTIREYSIERAKEKGIKYYDDQMIAFRRK